MCVCVSDNHVTVCAPVIVCVCRPLPKVCVCVPVCGFVVCVCVTDLVQTAVCPVIVSGELARFIWNYTNKVVKIYVKASGGRNYEETASYVLVVKVTDDGPGTLSSTCPITVNVRLM